MKKRIEHGPLPVDEALDVAMQVAQGLTKAHEAGIIHRDIKPANLIITEDGFVKIVDFGIAKLLGVTGPTQTGTRLGTVTYMSPEQINGEEADQQSDVWSLGAVLYEMLTSQLPFKGENQWAVMNAIGSRQPALPSLVRSDIQTDVEQVVLKALKKPKEKRCESAADFLTAARACRAELTQPASTAPASSSLRHVLFAPKVLAPVILLIMLISTWGLFAINRGSDVTWAREEAIPEVSQLAAEDRYGQNRRVQKFVDATGLD